MSSHPLHKSLTESLYKKTQHTASLSIFVKLQKTEKHFYYKILHSLVILDLHNQPLRGKILSTLSLGEILLYTNCLKGEILRYSFFSGIVLSCLSKTLRVVKGLLESSCKPTRKNTLLKPLQCQRSQSA